MRRSQRPGQRGEISPGTAFRGPELTESLSITIDSGERGLARPGDGMLEANADVTIDGTPVKDAVVDFVAVDDSWKVSHVFACNIVKSAQLDSCQV
ncbi:hypothetical protein ACFYO7_01660 [Nocardia salmonicida]|uniref:hypothetical protein n=1 Tax=Nocardia salmonicida TaxID=53431 RepID=UPI00367A552A